MGEPILLLLGKKPYRPSEPLKAPEKEEDKSEPKAQAKGKGKAQAKAKQDKNPPKKAKAVEQKPRPLEEFEEEHRPGGMMQIKSAFKSFVKRQVGEEEIRGM